jgi:hypothetical protein
MGIMGQEHSKWTPEKGDKIISLLEEGKFKVHAAAMVGIDRTTLYHWINESEKGEHEDWEGFNDFHIRVTEAESKYCQKMEDEINRLAAAGKNPDWRGAAFLLERKHPGLYGEKKKEIELSGGVKFSIPDLIAAIDEAEKERDNDNGGDK